jgi:hypothetical protein
MINGFYDVALTKKEINNNVIDCKETELARNDTPPNMGVKEKKVAG